MKIRAVLAPLALTLAIAAPAGAAEPIAGPQGVSFAGAPGDVARAYVAAYAPELRLKSVELGDAVVLRGAAGTTVRLAQRYRGLPVFDGVVAVRVGPGGTVRRAVLDVGRDLAVDTNPALDEAGARALVAQLRGRGFDGTMRITLGVRFQGLAAPALVWRADVATPDGGIRYDIDARSGNVIQSTPLAKNALGRVYAISSAVTPMTSDEALLDLDSGTALNGFSGGLSAYEYVSGAPGQNFVVSQNTAADSNGDYLFDPPADPLDEADPFAVVNTFYHTHRMRAFFEDTLGVDMSTSGWSLGAVANVLNSDGSPMDNAAFSPTPIGAPANKNNTIIIGQGSVSDFAYDSDVFLHEFTHYVAHNAIAYSDGQFGSDTYGINTFPGSIDEGTADYFACSVNGDPTLGEASLAPLGAVRDLSQNDVKCPDDLFGEVHEDGKVIGSLTWAVHETLGNTRADPLIWDAMTMLTHSSSLGDLASGIVSEAQDLEGQGSITGDELSAIQQAVKGRGLDDCGRVLSLDAKSRTNQLIGLDLVGQLFGANCSAVQGFGVKLNSLFHFSKKPASGASGVTFHATMTPDGSSPLSWAIYVRAGDHVTFTSGGALPLPSVSEFDYVADGFTGTDGSITVDDASDPPFDPSQTYYAVIVQQNCPNAELTMSAEDVPGGTGSGGGPASTSAGAGGSGGGPGAEPRANSNDNGGCGCRVPAEGEGHAPALALALVAAAAAAFRRRRRG